MFIKLLNFSPNFVGQILLSLVCNFSCKLLIKFDQMSIFWTLVTEVTSAQLFMHENAWHWDLKEKIEFNMNSIWLYFLNKMSSIISAVKSQDIDVISINKQNSLCEYNSITTTIIDWRQSLSVTISYVTIYYSIYWFWKKKNVYPPPFP